jgi:NADH pyrophosphatase NudC (nudix superfamily)
VVFYLFAYRGGDVSDHDTEIEEARWIPLAEAARSLTYAGEREMVARAMSRLTADR